MFGISAYGLILSLPKHAPTLPIHTTGSRNDSVSLKEEKAGGIVEYDPHWFFLMTSRHGMHTKKKKVIPMQLLGGFLSLSSLAMCGARELIMQLLSGLFGSIHPVVLFYTCFLRGIRSYSKQARFCGTFLFSGSFPAFHMLPTTGYQNVCQRISKLQETKVQADCFLPRLPVAWNIKNLIYVITGKGLAYSHLVETPWLGNQKSLHPAP